ncbi:ABC transporter permease [Haematobacter genomosp. 1]|uniref:Glycine/betaine ABC transporter permease n=1 Tax=Haematobacter genomosp. 1 TaxID=366618 RepID=A0A212AFJ9_9RHOB|nr:proline/glycine betaine ABC transporter permease [Haematobacter genomosp. 1]OWJ80183.1 glycine/betaine ABC transporter permease [Haematobacter genomosp. 1]
MSPADIATLPFDEWVNGFVRGWLVPNFRTFFRAAQTPITSVLNGLNGFLLAVPMLVMLLGFAAAAWRYAGKGMAIFVIVGFSFIDMIGLWPQTMTTLAMILTSVFFCAIIGIPAGILAARSDITWKIMRPVLDVMQTIPSFVYLVPIVMLFGVGMTPGIIATIIFALPPIVRLTNLGIRNVRADLIEAAQAFGSTSWQMLWDLQLPMAMRTIMAGLNQTLMMALSMVVIAALIGGGGLGLVVNTGLGRLDVGSATAGGAAIVILAITLDRITQGLADENGARRVSLFQTLKGFFGAGSTASVAEPAREPKVG